MAEMTQMESNVSWFPVKCKATKLFSTVFCKDTNQARHSCWSQGDDVASNQDAKSLSAWMKAQQCTETGKAVMQTELAGFWWAGWKERRNWDWREHADYPFREKAAQQLEGDNAGALGQMRRSRLAMLVGKAKMKGHQRCTEIIGWSKADGCWARKQISSTSYFTLLIPLALPRQLLNHSRKAGLTLWTSDWSCFSTLVLLELPHLTWIAQQISTAH